MSEQQYAKTMTFDGTAEGTLAIELDNMRYDLSMEEQARLIEFVIDGICPFCHEEIPHMSQVCCDCLGQIADYHERQEGCIGIQRR